MINSSLKTAIIIQVNCPSLIPYDINEMKGLAKTAGYNINIIIAQNLEHINPKFFLGRGKVEIINAGLDNFFFNNRHDQYNEKLLESEEFDENGNPFEEYENQEDNIEFDFPETIHKRKDITIIFNNRLGNMHRLNLTKIWDLKVVDRDELVLEIFERHAQTHESKLQIELARLNLETNIIKKELGQHLEEKQGRDFKGKGRKGWEPKMQAYRGRKKKIRDELKVISKRRNLRRKGRFKFFNVGLIGYTNAGKSTILNKLAKSRFETAQQEFTTIAPVSRKVVFPSFKENGVWDGQEVIITDSVGFIMDMSPALINAFLSTLEELQFSDLLLLIIDISEPNFVTILEKIRTTFTIMAQIEVMEIPRVLVLNKIDELSGELLQKRVEKILEIYPEIPNVSISALDKTGFDKISEIIIDFKQQKKYH